jgi:iron complex outermembrane receptor protein
MKFLKKNNPCWQVLRAPVGVCVAGVLFGGGTVAAQERASVSEKDFLADMPIVLSVSRLPQRLDETPGAVTVIDRDMIRRSGARDVADLMRLVPGFQVSNSFESVAPLVSYHGAFDSYSNRLELLIDGRSVYSPYFIGSIGPGLQTVALEDIDRIEVQRGSNSAAYGARAILGVINIVTRHTADTLGAQGTLTAGENGIADAQARLGWGDERATFRLTVDRRSDDGLVGSNGDNQVNRVNFRTDLHPNATDEVQLRFGLLSIDAGKGFAGNIDNALRRSSFGTHYAQIDWRRSLGVDQDLALNLSHTQETYEDTFPYSLQRFGINDFYSVSGSGRASNDTVSLQHTFRHGPDLRVVWGGEFRSERITSPALYNTDSAFVTDFTRLFGNVEWRVSPAVVINAGAMTENSSVTGDSFSPRVMINWHAAAGQTVRAGISRAFRPPSNYEKFANLRYVWNGILLDVNTLATGKVQPESVLAHEIGYLGEFPKWGLSLDVRAFHEQINGFIRQQNDTLPRDYANDESFAIQGIEYQVKWKPWDGAQIVFNQSYTDIDAKTYLPGGPWWGNLSGTPLSAPKLASSLSFFQKLPGNLDLTLTHHDNGTAALAGSGSGSRVAMTRTDVRLSKTLRWGRTNGELALVVQNLGLPYQDFSPTFQFQRQAFVTLRLEN